MSSKHQDSLSRRAVRAAALVRAEALAEGVCPADHGSQPSLCRELGQVREPGGVRLDHEEFCVHVVVSCGLL